MAAVDFVLVHLPRRLRGVAIKHRELLKFGVVGASTFFIDTAIFYALKLSILAPKPVTAKVIAVLVATMVSYVLNREWSFRTRGGRERHHEATLYFVFSGIGVVLYAAPLWISRYVFLLHQPYTSRLVEEISDFTAGQIIGVLVGMAFRWWAFRKWVFPDQHSRPPRRSRVTAPVVTPTPEHSDHVSAGWIRSSTARRARRRRERLAGRSRTSPASPSSVRADHRPPR